MINVGYNKKIFALFLDRARGDRVLRQYAKECDISYVQLRKLELCKQDSPPGIKLLKKMADHAANDVTYEDLLSICGYRDESALKQRENPIIEKMEKLTASKQKLLLDFADLLAKQED